MKSKLIIVPLIFLLCAGTITAREYTDSPISTGTQNFVYERDFNIINIAPKVFNCREIEIIEEETIFLIKDLSTEEILFFSQKVNETLYTTTTLNVRKNPNINYRRYNALAPNTKVNRVGWSQCGWDIIKIQEDLFFVWGEYLTEEQPENIVEIDFLEEDLYVISEKEEAVADTYYDEIKPVINEPSGTYTCAGSYRLTAYCWTGNPCMDGQWPVVGYTVACNDPKLWHKWIYIEGYGTYYVHDTGGMANDIIDIYLEDYNTCVQFGLQYSQVYIIN